MRLTVGADTDSIDTDAVGLGYLCRRLRVDVAAVVRTVGEKDNHFGLRGGVFHTVDCIRQAQADGGAVLYHSELDGLEEVNQHSMVCGKRTLRETLACEDHESDLVVGAGDDEVGGDLLRCLEAVRLQVFRLHGSRDVECHHNVNTLGGLR